MENLSTRLDRIWVGLTCGLIGPWFGLFIFYLIFFSSRSFYHFGLMMLNNGSTHSGLIAVSLIFNLVFFYIALQNNWFRAARGVIMAVFLYAPFVVYFKYVA